MVILRAALSGLLLLLLAGYGPSAANPKLRAKIDRSELEAAAVLAGDYLISQANKDGSFVYQVNMDPSVLLRFRYNWVRHAGALYALADFYDATRRTDIVPVIVAGAAYMQRRAIGWVDQFPGSLAVWSDPQVTGSRSLKNARLGDTGLGLAALTALERIKPGTVASDLQTGLARFIRSMQKPDGSFYSRYIPEAGGPNDKRTSLSSPGEAALGLTILYEQDRNPDWLAGARKTLQFLSASRKDMAEVPADHRALIATGRLWPHLDRRDREVFKRHARQVVESILSQQIWQERLITRGSFGPDGRTAPTATRLKGLLAAEKLFRDEPEFHNRVLIAISWGIHYLLRAQVKTDRFKGAMPRSPTRIKSSHPDAIKFNTRATEVRIDYVHHALSAFVGYVRLLASEN